MTEFRVDKRPDRVYYIYRYSEKLELIHVIFYTLQVLNALVWLVVVFGESQPDPIKVVCGLFFVCLIECVRIIVPLPIFGGTIPEYPWSSWLWVGLALSEKEAEEKVNKLAAQPESERRKKRPRTESKYYQR